MHAAINTSPLYMNALNSVATWCLKFEYLSILITAIFKVLVECEEMLPELQ